MGKNRNRKDGIASTCIECRTGSSDKKRIQLKKEKDAGVKTCIKCGKIKSISCFWKGIKNRKGGYSYLEVNTACKECSSKKSKKKKESELEKILLFKKGLGRCTKCNIVYSISSFVKSTGQYGVIFTCNMCKNKRTRELRSTPEGKLRMKESNKKTDRSKYKDTIRKWMESNRDYLNKQENLRLHNDTAFRIKKYLRRDINTALKKQKIAKTHKFLNIIGCTVDELIKHIESRFTEGMTWENHGQFGWHIDHIIPCASFDLTNEEEQCKCFHYTNLQPLWWIDNLKKGAKILS